MPLQANRTALLLFGLLLVSACKSTGIRDVAAIIQAQDPAEQAKEILESRGRSLVSNPSAWPEELRELRARIKKFEKLVDVIWGKKEQPRSGPKDYVKYTDKYYNRAHIDFDKGVVTVETLAPDNQRDYLKKAIVTTLLTPDDPREVDLYSDASPGESSSNPFLYEQVLDQDGKAIQWSWRANRYADYLIANNLKTLELGKRRGLQVRFPLVESHRDIRAYKYAPLVRKYSGKYGVTESLVYGVIKTESSFNPFAVSHAPAYGLMQIVPSTAGRDVFEKVKKRGDQPSPEYLYDPENNIDTGTAYLKILQEQYLSGVSNRESKRYSVISAYNGGAGNVLRTFSTDRNRAIGRINRLTPQQVYRTLTTKHPSKESRRYLFKVTEAQKEFWRNDGFRTPGN